MPSGVTTTTALSLISGVGVVKTDVSGVSTVLGATAGPPSVRMMTTVRNLASEIDGARNDIALMDVIDENNVEITYTLVEMNERVLKLLNPGSTATTATGITTVEPAAASALFTLSQYVKDHWIIWPVGADGTLTLKVPYALASAAQIGADNKSIGKYQVTLRAKLDMAASGATTDDAGYFWVLDPST